MSLRIILLGCLLLLLQLVSAEEPEATTTGPDEDDSDCEFAFGKPERIRLADGFQSFALLSSNYPSLMSFQEARDEKKEPAQRRYEATIERSDPDGQTRRCTFSPFNDPKATYELRLQSMRNGIEILEAIRTYSPTSEQAMDLFIVNLTDCSYNKSTLFKGYDFSKYRRTFIVSDPRDERCFDIISLDERKECGSYACRRTYYLENRTISEPRRFELLNNEAERDWRLSFLAPSADGGYFALVRRKSAIRLLSLAPDGSLLNSMEEKIESKVRFLKISTANDAFGACYREEKRSESLCTQFDRKLGVYFNSTMNFGRENDFAALYNLRGGGFVLAEAYCSSKACDSYEIRLRRIERSGEIRELESYRENSCLPRKRKEFELREEIDGRLCLYYTCDCKTSNCYSYSNLKTRCFGRL